jgi:hypothetical protein
MAVNYDHMLPKKYVDGRYIDHIVGVNVTLKRDQLLYIERYRMTKSCLISYTVGTGKTLCIMASLADILNLPGINLDAISVIVILKQTQIKDFMTNANKYGYSGKAIKGVKFTTYQLFHLDYAKYKNSIRAVIVDEMHRFSYNISNGSDAKSWVMSLNALMDLPENVLRIAVTATPMINTAKDIRTICKFLTKETVMDPTEAAQTIIKYSSVFSNQTPVAYPQPEEHQSPAPYNYIPPASNAFGRLGRIRALGGDYYQIEAPKEFVRPISILSSGTNIHGEPFRFQPSPNAIPTSMMADLVEASSPIFARWLRILSESYLDPGMTSIYFDSLKVELNRFARLLDLCGWSQAKSDTDLKSNAPNYVILTGERSWKPDVLVMPRSRGLNNSDGSIVKLVLFSTAYKEGASFLNTLRIFTLPVWNKATLDQCLGRSMRTNSYDAFESPPPARYLEPASNACFHTKKFMVKGVLMQIKPWVEINKSGDYHDTMKALNDDKDDQIEPVDQLLRAGAIKDIPKPSIPYTLAYCLNPTTVDINSRDIVFTKPKPRAQFEDFEKSSLISDLNQYKTLKTRLDAVIKTKLASTGRAVGSAVSHEYYKTLQDYLPYAWYAPPHNVPDPHLTYKTRVFQASLETSDFKDREIDEKISALTSLVKVQKVLIEQQLSTLKYGIVKYVILDRCIFCGMQVNRVLNRCTGVIKHNKCNEPIPDLSPFKYALYIDGIFRPFSNLNTFKDLNRNRNGMMNVSPPNDVVTFEDFLHLSETDSFPDIGRFPEVVDHSNKR